MWPNACLSQGAASRFIRCGGGAGGAGEVPTSGRPCLVRSCVLPCRACETWAEPGESGSPTGMQEHGR